VSAARISAIAQPHFRGKPKMVPPARRRLSRTVRRVLIISNSPSRAKHRLASQLCNAEGIQEGRYRAGCRATVLKRFRDVIHPRIPDEAVIHAASSLALRRVSEVG